MTDKQPDVVTVGEAIRAGAAALSAAGVFCGHGTDNTWDEAAWLVLHAAGLDPGEGYSEQQLLSAGAARRLSGYLRRRIEAREPAAYITGEAWFCGLRFKVNASTLIPRSPFAELIAQRFEPWLAGDSVHRILEVGTGSGCIAIALARAFPRSEVVATDISADALAVATENRRQHGLEGRLQLIQADLLAGLHGPYDLIVSNPPYVPETEAPGLPAEYAHEPALGLYSGPDGLASVRRILQDAGRLLAPAGLLALEVGAGWHALEQAFPRLPFIWPELEAGGEGIGLLSGPDLRQVS